MDLVRSLVEPHTGPLSDDQITTRPSRNQRYVAITVTITATSQEQLDNIYRALSGHEEMLVVL